jgi:hypothetical protein
MNASTVLLTFLLVSGPGTGVPRATQARFDFSCAAFPQGLDESDLVARYGGENVVSAQITGADDAPFGGTVLFPNQEDARVDIAWRDPQQKRAVAWIRIQGQRSRWRLPNGVALGDDLLGVERRNGRPFRLAPLSVEGQGAVRSWSGGRIRNVNAGQCSVKISFQPLRDGTEDPSLMRQLVRGREFSSGHPAMQSINPRMRAIWILNSVR